MVSFPFNCLPVADISGGPFCWQVVGELPWIEIKTSLSIRNHWLRLTWRCGFFDPISRPVVRCELDDGTPNGNHDVFLPGAPFGRSTFVIHIPAGTKRLLVSPTNRVGELRFEIERIDSLPLPFVFALALSLSLGRTLHAFGAALIGRRADMRHLLRRALSDQRLNRFRQWLLQGTRPLDPVFDGERRTEGTHVRFLIDADTVGEGQQLSVIRQLSSDLAASLHKDWSITVLMTSPLDSIGMMAQGSVGTVRASADRAVLLAGLNENDLVAEVPLGTRLHRHALDMIVAAASALPETQLFYGDSDHFDRDGLPCQPTFRPGFDPIWLERCDYIGSSAIWRVAAVRRLGTGGGSRHLPDPAQAEAGESLSRFIFRFPLPPMLPVMQRRRNGLTAVTDAILPTVAILIPTRDRLDLLRPCIDSILEKTTGLYQINILDNESCEDKTKAYFDKIQHNPRIKIDLIPGPFNFSRICNEGAKSVSADVLVFLNNDTMVIDGDWLKEMASIATRQDVGAVGLKLLFPNGRVQHAGVIAGLFGRAGHFDLGIKGNDAGFFGRANVPHQLLAVTGACLAVMQAKFLAVDGFDERHLPIDLNDIDLCFRLVKKGWKTVQLGSRKMYHLESASRGHARNYEIAYAAEQKYFSESWVSVVRADPFFSPNLSLYSMRGRLG